MSEIAALSNVHAVVAQDVTRRCDVKKEIWKHERGDVHRPIDNVCNVSKLHLDRAVRASANRSASTDCTKRLFDARSERVEIAFGVRESWRANPRQTPHASLRRVSGTLDCPAKGSISGNNRAWSRTAGAMFRAFAKISAAST
jgi:hypothetical protein